ncbi:MAG TPA: type II secretion system F family protein [Gemmataceae bacterium]|jgi:general secretion pathway protein F/type IV pilus assembly protein PilC
MAEFTYEARAKTGTLSNGTLTAATAREAMAILDARGLFPVRIAEAQTHTRRRWGKRVKGRHLSALFSQLADLLHSGVPLLRSLEILERQSSLPAVGEVLREVRAEVAEGTTMADAMAKHPHVFNELTVSMVRAGQEGGFLEDVLKRIADFTEHQEDLKSKVVGSLAYPVFLAAVGTVVLLILVVFVVPKFERTFDKLREKGDLPALTVGLMAFSHFLIDHWFIGAAGLIAVVWGTRRWLRTDRGRLLADGWRLRLPGAGHIFLHLAIARFARILGTLLHNGIPILQSLRIAKDSTGNRVLTAAIENSAENVTAGNSLAKPLSQCKYFPRDVVEMVSVAEESNSLETVLINIADGLEKRTSRQLELFVKLLEPVMLLVMACIVLLVVVGLLLPIFKMGSTVQ